MRRILMLSTEIGGNERIGCFNRQMTLSRQSSLLSLPPFILPPSINLPCFFSPFILTSLSFLSLSLPPFLHFSLTSDVSLSISLLHASLYLCFYYYLPLLILPRSKSL